MWPQENRHFLNTKPTHSHIFNEHIHLHYSLEREEKKHFHSGLFLTLVCIPSSRLPLAGRVQGVNFSANSFTMETLKNDSNSDSEHPLARCNAFQCYGATGTKEQRSVTAPSYSCDQAGLCSPPARPGPAQVHSSVSSHKALGFYITALLSRV